MPERPIVQPQQSTRPSQATMVKRYMIVSVFNIVSHQAILFVANSLWGWSGGSANVLAASIVCVFAYFLNRNWVWASEGSHSFRRQILPFWATIIVGLIVSTALSAGAEARFGSGLAVNLASFVGYGFVWVGKFFVLSRVFGNSATDVASAESEAASAHPPDASVSAP